MVEAHQHLHDLRDTGRSCYVAYVPYDHLLDDAEGRRAARANRSQAPDEQTELF